MCRANALPSVLTCPFWTVCRHRLQSSDVVTVSVSHSGALFARLETHQKEL